MYSKYVGLTKTFLKTFICSGATIALNVNCKNQPSKRWAGHSKWQNIKSAKAASDKNKAMVFQRLCNLIQLQVKQSGPDVNTNPKLKSLVEEARKVSMPKKTIEKALTLSQTLDKPYWVVFSGPKGVVMGFEVVFSNRKPTYLLTKLGTHTKKIRLKMEPHFSHLCNERGIIIADPLENTDGAYEKALEDAIEVGIDEVHENDDKSFLFEFSPERLDSYTQQLMKKGYNILSSTTELEFKEFTDLDEEEIESIEKVISTVQNIYTEVLRLLTSQEQQIEKNTERKTNKGRNEERKLEVSTIDWSI